MFEKVNPSHPDKVADRIAGAIVDLAYSKDEQPKIAVEVLIGHGKCYVMIESSLFFDRSDINQIVDRIAGNITVHVTQVPQDKTLAANQDDGLRCGDNGIFVGVPVDDLEFTLTAVVRHLYTQFPTDGKFIIDDDGRFIMCQSCVDGNILRSRYPGAIVNPLGDWTGGLDVDSGATNRKLGSDMGRAVTGGGLHGKDLSKADVAVNIYAHLKAQRTGKVERFCCAIGDTEVDGVPYKNIVNTARQYIESLGGFEKFAEWGILR